MNNKRPELSDELALIGAVGLCVLVVFLLAEGLEFNGFYLCCVLVDEPEMGLSVVGHFKQKMEQVIVDAHISLLIVHLMNLDGDIGLRDRQFHLFPDLKRSI